MQLKSSHSRLVVFWSLVVTACLVGKLRSSAQEDESASPPPNLSGPVKIAGLLWKPNPKSAAATLVRTIEKAFDRGMLPELRDALSPLAPKLSEVVAADSATDPRFGISLAATALLGPHSVDLSPRIRSALGKFREESSRELLLRVWFHTDKKSALDYFVDSLAADEIPTPWKVIVMREAVASDRSRATHTILSEWPTLSQAAKIAAIEPLTSSADSMAALVDAIRAKRINKDLVNTNQLRKWLASDDLQLKQKITSVWGTIREVDDAERQKLVEETLGHLRSGVTGSAGRGRQIFQRVCSQCHVLHGEGYEVGPNIVNNGRGSLEQLVSNVLDPSLVVGVAFQAKTVLTVDGQIVSGLIAAENDRYLRLKIQGGKTVEFDKQEDIEDVQDSTKSLMPEGVESQMTRQELQDLFAYLCLLGPPDSPDNALIPGTPEGFVVP